MKQVADGIFGFNGGMDLSREPYAIGENQCVRIVNGAITAQGDKLEERPGWVCQVLNFESKFVKEIYEAGCFQGEGWAFDGRNRYMLASVSGWILQFTQEAGETWAVKILNRGDQNNPDIEQVWFVAVGGDGRVILQDGQSLPFIIQYDSAERVDGDNVIGVGRMGAWVQQRYFYADETGTVILASDINDPTSATEGLSTGLWGFSTNKATDEITAISRQKNLSRDINGGSLLFSTKSDLYAANVLGERITWQAYLVVADSAAVSHASFTNFNSNIYYRTKEKGISDFRQSAVQFLSDQDLYQQSAEVDPWLNRDSEYLLDHCISKAYKNRLLTTVAPRIRPNGGVYHLGLLSMHPDPSYGGRQRQPRRWEGLWTGVRPQAMTSLLTDGPTRLYCHSYDADGVSRMYRLAPELNHDVDYTGRIKEIHRIIEPRSFAFGNPAMTKELTSHQYSLQDIDRVAQVTVFSRPEGSGEWSEFWSVNHSAGDCECFCEAPCYQAQDRPCVVMSKANKNPDIPGIIPGFKSFHHSYRMEITGAGELDRILVQASEHPHSSNVFTEPRPKVASWEKRDDFSYTI